MRHRQTNANRQKKHRQTDRKPNRQTASQLECRTIARPGRELCESI